VRLPSPFALEKIRSEAGLLIFCIILLFLKFATCAWRSRCAWLSFFCPARSDSRFTQEVVFSVLSRKPRMCNILEWKGKKIIYKRSVLPPLKPLSN
jgi:hypothetical protein